MPTHNQKSLAKKEQTAARPKLMVVAMRHRLYVRASVEDLERWRRAAEADGADSVSALARKLLDGRAAKVARRPGMSPPAVVDGEADWRTKLDRIARGGT
jgi:hypothetical protein